jgi:hypothetical protein
MSAALTREQIHAGGPQSARSILRAACLATDVRVQRSARYAQLVTLDVIRRNVTDPADS